MHLVLYTLLLLAAIGAAHAQTCTSCDGGTLDRASGLCLPARVEGAHRRSAPDSPGGEVKTHRHPIAARYDAMHNRLAVNVMMYDRERAESAADDEEMRSVVRDVLDAHRDAKLEMGGGSSLPIAGEPMEAEAAWITWSEGLTDFVSLLWLLPRADRWMKVTATYVRPAENAGEAAQFALDFVRSVTNSICKVR